MLQKLLLIFKIKELRAKVLFILAMLTIFRVAAAIPIPGVDEARLESFFQANQFFGLLNMFSGGGLSNLSIVMLGVAPYITATIIMQLLTMVFPAFKEMYQEEGEAGRQKFNQYARFLTVPLAVIQAYGFLTLLKNQGIILEATRSQFVVNIIVITAGTLFLMWLGELITEKGIGNGVSLLIFAGIVTDIPLNVGQALVNYSREDIPTYVLFVAIALIVIAGVVVITEGQRNIPVAYAKRVRGYRVYGGVSTYLPLRVNQAGVIPIIFALSILLFPAMIANLIAAFGNERIASLAQRFSDAFQNNLWLYGSLYFIFVFLFTYFYTAVTFDPKAISDNIQKQGGFIPGIRPGRATAEFLSKILNRTTLVGALFLGVIAVLPIVMRGFTGLTSLTIGGTALLIVVSVVLETMKQIEAQLTMRDYEGF